MGLRDLKRKLDAARAANSAWDAIEGGAKVGKLKPVIFGLVGGIVTGIVSACTSACPALSTSLKAFAVASLLGAITAYMAKPRESAGFKATITGLATAALGAFVVKLNAVCPDFVSQLPQLVMLGFTTGVGLYLKNHRQV